MASGRTHEAINLAVFGALTGGYALVRTTETVPPFAGEVIVGFSLAYLLGTFFVTPDMDLAEIRVRPKARWGWLGFLWVPYGKLFRHRGASHSWLFGPFTRLVYLLILLFGLAWFAAEVLTLFGYPTIISPRRVDNWQGLLIGFAAGFYLSQWLHLLADGVGPSHGRDLLAKQRDKRSKKQRSRRSSAQRRSNAQRRPKR